MAGFKAILKKIEETMAAVAFAEAGDFDTARQMVGAGKNSNKKVLLGLEQEHINEKIIRNALQLSQRIGGKLEIFHMYRSSSCGNHESTKLANEKADLLGAYKAKFQNMGVYYQCMDGEGCLADALLKYIANRRDILCVVFGEKARENSGPCRSANEKLLAILHKLKCPMVVYSAT